MKKFFLLATMLVALTFTSSAFAAGYGAAGCGFGGTVIKENKILPQIGAWFLNGILGNQTFGITSGTSECGSSGLILAEKNQKVFVENNYNNLAKEMAAGEGENLYTLAGLLGCSADHAVDFNAFTQKNYASIFKSNETTPTEMLETLKEGLSNDQVFASSCQRL